MANFEFQCDSKLLSKEQTNFITDVLIKLGFTGGKVVFQNIGKANDNYGSNVKRIIVESNDGKILKMVAKIAHNTDIHRAMSVVESIFHNELLMYTKVLPKFRQLQIEAGIEENDIFQFPKCYGVYEEKPYEIVLLEDLDEQDYVMLSKSKGLSDQEVRVVLKEFANLHSLSFVLKEKDPTTYKELADNLVNFFVSTPMEEQMKNTLPMVEQSLSFILDTERYKNSIKGSLKCMIDEAHKLSKYDKGSKYNVIIHGDSWTNNVLFKLKDGIPQTCMLIDYQLSFERSPVSDLLYLIFCCTDYITRSKYYNDWIDFYHNELDNYLSLYGIKVSYVYSKEKMLSDLKRYAKFFLGWSIMFNNFLNINEQVAAKLKEDMENNESIEHLMEKVKTENKDNITQGFIKTRIQGILESYYELGYEQYPKS